MQIHPLIIFTDLDGSLLDHHTYSHAAADSTLRMLEEQNIPVIANTSKTRSELEAFRQQINNQHPFIAENGAAVFIPVNYFAEQPADTQVENNYWVKKFVANRQHWQSLLNNTEFSDCYTSFQEAGIAGIMTMTGLDKDSATRAAEKEYSEPIEWHGTTTQAEQFIQQLQSQGANVLQGGRFMHISGQCDKGQALQWLANLYSATTVAIGDSHNDIAMLETADHALIIRSPVHEPPTLTKQNSIYISENPGPQGWAEAVQYIINLITKA